MLNQDEIGKLKQNLFLLDLNFVGQNLPTLDEVIEYQQSQNIPHPKLEELKNGNAPSQLYAAILTNAIDEAKSIEILQDLENDSTPIKVQYIVGNGLIEVPIKFPSKSFREHGDIRKGFVEKVENLKKLRLAIETEARKRNIAADLSDLPDLSKIDESQITKENTANLANHELIAKRFYAAGLLLGVDNQASQEIFDNLLNEESFVPYLSGDIMEEIPAKLLAKLYLMEFFAENEKDEDYPTDFGGRFWNSLKNLLPF